MLKDVGSGMEVPESIYRNKMKHAGKGRGYTLVHTVFQKDVGMEVPKNIEQLAGKGRER